MSRDADPSNGAKLSTSTVEAIANRVAELLRRELGPTPGLLTTDQVAERFAVSKAWVYEHADELGAVRLGAGPRARLRFDPKRVSRAMTPRTANGRPQNPPRQAAEQDELLPVYGRARSAQSSNRGDTSGT